MALVVKMKATVSVKQIAFEREFDPCKRTIFFQDEGGENREFQNLPEKRDCGFE